MSIASQRSRPSLIKHSACLMRRHFITSASNMSKRIQYKVDGRVQGVCFRAYTVEEANKLGVTGFVKNASDGTVIGEAQGDDGQIQQFTQWLNKGPSAAKVSGVEHSDIEPKQGESGFKQ